MSLKCDAVFQGGGVKGIGFAGAIETIERSGYTFENVAGTSAGAIIACLIAVGYSSVEIYSIMKSLDFSRIAEKSCFFCGGIIGKAINAGKSYGIYKTGYLEGWLDELLRKKNKLVFGDIRTEWNDEKYAYKFQAIAADINHRRMLVLPGDLREFGIDPDNFSISKAVIMSMSIPIFFKPFKLKDIDKNQHLVVDGGLLSNYPIWLLDDGTSRPPWPTFGFKFTNDTQQSDQFETIGNIFEYGKSIVSTMMEAGDNYHISESKGDFQRTILIPTEIDINGKKKRIKTTYFNITEDEKETLYLNGMSAARRFLSGWDFNNWITAYRAVQ